MAPSPHECKCRTLRAALLGEFHSTRIQIFKTCFEKFVKASVIWWSGILIFALSPWPAWQPWSRTFLTVTQRPWHFQQDKLAFGFLDFQRNSIANETFNLYGNIWVILHSTSILCHCCIGLVKQFIKLLEVTGDLWVEWHTVMLRYEMLWDFFHHKWHISNFFHSKCSLLTMRVDHAINKA